MLSSSLTCTISGGIHWICCGYPYPSRDRTYPHALPCSSSDVRHSYSQSISMVSGAGSSKIDGPKYRWPCPEPFPVCRYTFTGIDATYSEISFTHAYRGVRRSALSVPCTCWFGCAGPPTLNGMNGLVQGCHGTEPMTLDSVLLAATRSSSPMPPPVPQSVLDQGAARSRAGTRRGCFFPGRL